MDQNVEARPSNIEIKRNVQTSKIENTDSWVDGDFEQNPNIEVIIEDGTGERQGPPKGDTSVLQTYFNMFKCFIGIGILATPHAI